MTHMKIRHHRKRQGFRSAHNFNGRHIGVARLPDGTRYPYSMMPPLEAGFEYVRVARHHRASTKQAG